MGRARGTSESRGTGQETGQETGHGTDWYRSAARPLLFSLPPEAAHRLAQGLLGLPLPWERLGGADRDPALRLSLAGIPLANPVGLAAGFDKTGRHLDALGRLGFGYVVCGTFTRRPRRGNAKPRIVRYPERGSMVNAMGLPNPGAEAASRALARTPRRGPRVASIADQDVPDVLEAHAVLEPFVDAIELNASCPNVAWGRDRDNEAHLANLLRALAGRRARPLFVKLPPFRTRVEREVVLALAAIAQERGADALTISNTLPVRDPRVSIGRGGLSGRALLDVTLSCVRAVRGAMGPEVPVNASGGISTSADALAAIEAGATTVQVYTGLIFRGPGVVGELTTGLAGALRSRRIDLAALAGTA
ncbi:MAG TPA: dihydroorotate dehydrogenase 2 [Actinomycetota bacterium]|nr:dihydroorotate dehydrogenase 2 [Actinomycetota bacterium]